MAMKRVLQISKQSMTLDLKGTLWLSYTILLLNLFSKDTDHAGILVIDEILRFSTDFKKENYGKVSDSFTPDTTLYQERVKCRY